MQFKRESGVALISAMLVLILMSALLVGFLAFYQSDMRASGANRDQSRAYAAAHAGVEKMTSDLGQLFQTNFNPTGPQVQALAASAMEPTFSASEGITYSDPVATDGYRVSFIDRNGDNMPDLDNPNGTVIPAGPYQGLVGLITPYNVDVTARLAGGAAEVRMRRTVQTVAIPVFQFGIFSENDLSFFAGPNFNFGGRVHTNQNIYLGQGANTTLTLADRVTAVGEVVRTHMSNGRQLVGDASTQYTGTVSMARAQNCPATPANCRALAAGEGSVTVATVPPSILTWVAAVPGTPAHYEMRLDTANGNAINPNWESLSTSTYNNYIRNGATGARRLDLPIVDASAGTSPVDLIRRPRQGDPMGAGTPFKERFYNLASLRILLSDNIDDIRNLPGISAGDPLDLNNLGAAGYVVDANHPPIAQSGAGASYAVNANSNLIRGFIKIDRQRTDGTWQDVTLRILNLGFAGRNLSNGNQWVLGTGQCDVEPNPDAIIRFQRLKDNPANGLQGGAGAGLRCGNTSQTATDYIPNTLYDPREGGRRTNDSPWVDTDGDTVRDADEGQLYLGGIMHYVELDVANLKKWFEGTSDTGLGVGSESVTGYTVYFSDRRSNKDWGPDGVPVNADDRETGEFGNENFVNAGQAAGDDDLVFDAGEDVNGNTTQQLYGATARVPPDRKAGSIYDPAATPTVRTRVLRDVARVNPTAFFRRALKIVNGARGQLPFVNRQGLTIASENPVYVQGNYNACESMSGACAVGFDGANGVPLSNPPHVSAAVIADTVTLLSRAWNDLISFNSPHISNNRNAATTWYRLGIISGKGLSFPNFAEPKDWGTDGGAHNFLRYIEDWGGQTLNYRGSIVSLYINRQAVGVYKCCGNVYDPPTRGYNFEQEFLSPALLPPKTPMFRDINTLSFRQILRPTEP